MQDEWQWSIREILGTFRGFFLAAGLTSVLRDHQTHDQLCDEMSDPHERHE